MPPARGHDLDGGRERGVLALKGCQRCFGVEPIDVDREQVAGFAARDADVVGRLEAPPMSNHMRILAGIQTAARRRRQFLPRPAREDVQAAGSECESGADHGRSDLAAMPLCQPRTK
jgi:hypothetical protein